MIWKFNENSTIYRINDAELWKNFDLANVSFVIKIKNMEENLDIVLILIDTL